MRRYLIALSAAAAVMLAGCSSSDDKPEPAAGDVVTASSSAAPTGPTAQQVVDAFTAAGLPAPNPRDNSKNCADLGCKQMITTDAITVMSFDDPAAEAHVVQSFGKDAHQKGQIVLSYAAARTPAADRPKYEAALNGLG